MTVPAPHRSLASRVTVLTTVAVALAVAFVAAGAWATVRMQMQSTLDASLVDRAHAAAKYPALSNLTSDYQLPSWALGAADVRIAFVYADGSYRTYDQLPRMKLAPEIEVATGERDSIIRTISAGGTRYRVVAVPSGPGTALVVAQSLEPQQRVLSKLGMVMLLFGLLGVAGAAGAGWAVARNGLRPVRRLTAEVEAIARTEDLTPIEVAGDDEVARLAAAFNGMLTALAASRDRQRQLVADAGHELRTPLTSLRTNIELLTQADGGGAGAAELPAAARAELLDDVRAQIEELTTLIGDLVELSRDDPSTHVVAPVDLAEVLDQAVARVRRRAPGLVLEVTAEPLEIVGDAAALERAVTNLLDNAVKWSPPGGTVTVRLVDGVLTVDDEGPGIAEADRPHVFDRFWRSEESRGMPGSGLGLSIVRQVADRHAGRLEVADSPAGGARLVLALPAAGQPVATEPARSGGRR
ncbi:HAMP domain-containing sensor histidine kinase [Nocardioides sp. SYSU DS0663]|uniref:HAMP domain-containing sensor histidine kinase n=1 Tax=Nocardioides sp. SYSU DS0663 TaxID=3416445 RepID=UPI003F4C838E